MSSADVIYVRPTIHDIYAGVEEGVRHHPKMRDKDYYKKRSLD